MATHINSKDKAGIGYSQFHILRYLCGKEPANLNQITNKLDISKSAATQMVDDLIDKGILNKKSNPEDKRGVLISFSLDWKKRFKSLKQKKMNKFSSIFDSLSDKELERLLMIISKIYKSGSIKK
jgi:DNA-binding MarR family transcriptional regulator